MSGSERSDDLERRVSALVEREEILDVLARYCECIDECDFAGLSEVFAQDCRADYGPGRGGPLVGLEAVSAQLASVVPTFAHTHHQLGQVRTSKREDGSWDTTAYATAWHQYPDGSTAISRVRYVDRFVGTDAGWRIAERRLIALGTEGWDNVEYRFVERRSQG